MQLRHLRYFVALARERHFRRAADACHITQSTLSAAIRQLEDEIGSPLIERDKRFRDFTAEGQAFLAWARRMLAERDTLDQELSLLRQGLRGQLRLGVIPTALPTVALVTTPFNRRYPQVTLRIVSRSSDEIQRGLDELELDAGLTYLDNEPLKGVQAIPLYEERYILLTPADGPFAGKDVATWLEAAETSLCLLTPDMQNRRIIDQVFGEIGVTPRAQVETNSLVALFSQIRAGAWSSVLSQNLLWLFGMPAGMVALPLVEPERTHTIGLVVREREPETPLVKALKSVCGDLDLSRQYWSKGRRQA